MSKFYNKLDNDFTQIPNTILQDTRISALAFKIYCYICFRIGRNAEWEFFNNDILNHCKEGKYSLVNAKKELIKYGYLEKVKQNHKENGDFGGCDYIIYKEPVAMTEIATTLKPTSKIATTLNQSTNNKDIEINKDLKNKELNKQKTNKKENPDILKSHEEIETFFNNKCNEAINGVEIVNNDFSKEELFLMSEFAINRVIDKKGIKNTKAALKVSVYNPAIKLKASLAGFNMDFKEVFAKDDTTYIYLMKSGGMLVIDSLKPWIIECVVKDKRKYGQKEGAISQLMREANEIGMTRNIVNLGNI